MTEQVWAILCVREDADIVEYTVRQMFGQGADGMIADLSHLSRDGTHQILVKLAQEFPIQIVIDTHPSFYYYQGEITTHLAQAAHALGAGWIVPFDADEMVYAVDGQTVAEVLRNSRPDVVVLPMWNYFASGMDDQRDPNPLTREQWRKSERNKLNKVCFRWSEHLACANGNHSVAVNGETRWGEYAGVEIGHFQNRRPEQMIRKIRNERGVRNESDPDYGYWHKFAELTDTEIAEWWAKEYFFVDPVKAGLVHEPAPYLRSKR